MFSYAVEIDQLSMNPIHGIPALPEQPTRQIEAWPIPVIQAVANATLELGSELDDYHRELQAPWAGQRNFTLIMLAACTGMRQSELLGLQWSEVDDDWIHVTHKLCRRSFTRRETKSRRGNRRVPILGPARALIESWRAVGAHESIVFPNHAADNFIRVRNFDVRVWDRARANVGVIEHDGEEYDARKMTFHELRHTFVSVCLAAGRDVWEVANWAGDDPEMIKRVYGHYIPGSLGDTSRLEQALLLRAPK
jgi:integrase